MFVSSTAHPSIGKQLNQPTFNSPRPRAWALRVSNQVESDKPIYQPDQKMVGWVMYFNPSACINLSACYVYFFIPFFIHFHGQRETTRFFPQFDLETTYSLPSHSERLWHRDPLPTRVIITGNIPLLFSSSKITTRVSSSSSLSTFKSHQPYINGGKAVVCLERNFLN